MINMNQLDDDFNNRALSSLNQRQNVLPVGTHVPTSVSSINSGTGTIANPGPTGFGGNDRPGRRTYNPLSKLSSYTYNITLYMITPDAYQAFIESGRRNINAVGSISLNNGNSTNTGKITSAGAYIVAQSGGINNTTGKRAIGDRDFYIDNLRFKTAANAKATDTSSVVTDFEFQITEPYGFSFVTELGKANLAMQQYIANIGNIGSGESAGPTNPWKNFFILGIRFYGYDKDGNIVKPDSQLFGEVIDPIGTGGELFENYYDITISELKFKLDGKTVVYNIKAAGVSGQTLLGIKRGRVTTGANVTGATVKDCLYGENGLFTLLSKQQNSFVTKDPKNQNYPNKYNVVWLGNSESLIGNAKVVTQSDLDKWRWGGNKASSTAQATDAASNTPPDNNSRQFTFDNDTSIISCIEQIIKKSEFMESALQSVYSNAKEPDYKQKNNEQVRNIGANTFSWFNVSAEIAKATWDDKIKDWCYETNYVIQTYDVPSMQSSYVKNPGIYYGAHKRYDYWFTGKNSEVLDFSLNFDTLYFTAQQGIENQNTADKSSASDPGAREGQNNNSSNQNNSGSSTGNTATTAGNTGLKADSPPTTNGDNSAGTATAGGLVSVAPGQRSGGDKTGNLGTTGEAQNSVLTYMNEANAYAGGTIKILGDPDFLMRDAASSVQELYNKFYDTDGYTISAHGGQIFIEVALREAVDYNNENGLMDLNENILFVNYPPYIKEMAKGAIIYMVVDVTSTFSGGKFEQVLNLTSTTFDGMGEWAGPIQTKNPPEVTGDTGLSANDDANKPKTPFEQQLANARPNVPTPLPPPKMSAGVLGSSTANILNNTDNFGRPTTINTFGQ